MKHIRVGDKRGEFVRLLQSRQCQAYLMTQSPGDTSSEQPNNEHPRSEQWLFVVSGIGTVAIGKPRKRIRRVSLKSGSLLLIEKGELHQVVNTGRRRLVTLNFYVPPAYNRHGEPK